MIKSFKNISAALALATCLLSGVSCVKELDTVQNGVISTSSFYQTDADCEEAVTAIYCYSDQMHTSYYHPAPWYIKTLLSDEIYNAGGQRNDGVDQRNINEYNFDASNSYVETVFEGLYSLIYRANLVINNFDPSESATFKRGVAEAKVFRAWANMNLAILWGNAPLVLEAVRDDYRAGNSEDGALWAQVEKDLGEAIDSGALPVKSSISDKVTSRVTLQYAQALLGKAYVFEKKYAEAEKVLDKVVNSGLYGLLEDYTAYSLSENNNNCEVLFGTHPTDDANVNTTMFPWVFLAPSGNFWDGIYATPLSMIGFGWINPSQSIVDAFLQSEPDSRRFLGTLKSYNRMVQDYPIFAVKESNPAYAHCGYFNWKYRASSSGLVTGTYFVFNLQFPIMKYSEVILLDAEAKIQSGGAGAGDDLINMIRRKAGVPELSGATMDDLKNEKRLECYMDGCRFDDLVRWGDAEKALKNCGAKIPELIGLNADGSLNVNPARYTNSSYGFKSGKHDKLPYPQKELDLNPNITQNSGWE